METHRDTPLARFSAFWWGIGLFFLFAILLLFARPMFKKEVVTLDDVEAEARTARRAEITSKQAAYFETKIVEKGKTAQVLPSVVFSSVGKELLSTPTPVKKPEQLVPASPTAQALQGQSNPPAQ